MLFALATVTNLSSAEVANFSFEAAREKVIAPRGEKMSNPPAVG